MYKKVEDVYMRQIEMSLEMNIPKKGIIKRLQDKLNISMQQADEYFRMYGTCLLYTSIKISIIRGRSLIFWTKNSFVRTGHQQVLTVW